MQISTEREWIILLNFDSVLSFEEITITDEMMEDVKGELEDSNGYNPTDEDIIADILVYKMQEVEQGWGKAFPIPKSELSKLKDIIRNSQ